MEILNYIIIGIIEGLTEFIPVSSTGHLIIAEHFLGPFPEILETVIQFAAILAVCWYYRERLLHVSCNILSDKKSQIFTLNLLLAFIPTAIAGLLFYSTIKEVLFSPKVVSISLIIGGIIILIVERLNLKPKYKTVDKISPKTALYIGLFQILSLIPGASRSGSTIIGAMLVGVDRKTAVEFSFLLALPTIFAATFYDLYKFSKTSELTSLLDPLFAAAIVSAFITAFFVVKLAISYVSKNSLAPFGWYRIIFGAIMLFLFSS
mgnify:FL=1